MKKLRHSRDNYLIRVFETERGKKPPQPPARHNLLSSSSVLWTSFENRNIFNAVHHCKEEEADFSRKAMWGLRRWPPTRALSPETNPDSTSISDLQPPEPWTENFRRDGGVRGPLAHPHLLGTPKSQLIAEKTSVKKTRICPHPPPPAKILHPDIKKNSWDSRRGTLTV